MTLVLVVAVLLLVCVAAGTVVVVRRGSARGDLHAEAAHGAARGFDRAVHDARTVHNAAAMGDQYHR